MVVLISALEHYAYCPRQCALIHVDGIWVDNRHTVRGHRFHERVDSGKSTLTADVRTLRGLELWSVEHDLAGRADAVELHPETVIPVEYKAGTRHGRTADIQLCAQALCLEEMFGVVVPAGAIWFGRHRRRRIVEFDEELRILTIDTIEAVARSLSDRRLPEAVNDQRCRECQLIGHCMPGEVAGGADRASLYLAEQFGLVQ